MILPFRDIVYLTSYAVYMIVRTTLTSSIMPQIFYACAYLKTLSSFLLKYNMIIQWYRTYGNVVYNNISTNV